jgi:hypothetical protein
MTLPADVAAWWEKEIEARGQAPAIFRADPAALPRLVEDADVSAAVVLAGFDVRAFVSGLVSLLRSLSEDERRPWYRAFTRTILFAGQPRKLAERFPPQIVDPDGTVAWYRPRPKQVIEPMSRLLARFPAGRAALDLLPPNDVRLGEAAGGGLEVVLDPAGMSLSEYLIHLGHSVSEPWARRVWDGRGEVLLCHRPVADIDVAQCAYLRLGGRADGTLRLVGYSRVIGESERRS